MTSEVVVMNRMGIALAADSVVSIYANGVQKKRHDSVAKLFMMSERHPVGIMVYNNASLLGVPWETIIKLFRKQLGQDSFQSLEEYGQELIVFLMNHRNLFPSYVEQKYFEKEFEAECYRIVKEAEVIYRLLPLARRIEFGNRDKARSAIVAEVIIERLACWEQQDDAVGFNKELAKEFIDSMSGEVSKIIRKVLSDWFVDSSGVMGGN